MRPQEQFTTNISTNNTAILNQYGATCGLSPVTPESLKAVYPGASTGENAKHPTQRVTHSVHAECTLAMHALAMRRDWTYVELGISKGSCWLCEKFLAYLKCYKVNFLVSRFHGKLQPGWTCPRGVSAEDDVVVANIVGEALQEIIERVLNRRRSDSFPLPGGELENVGREGFSDDDFEWFAGAVGEV